MRKAIALACLLAAACGGGEADEVERTPSSVPGTWIKVCNGGWFCTLTVGSCDAADSSPNPFNGPGSCTTCDPNTGQC